MNGMEGVQERLQRLRREYLGAPLDIASTDPDPLRQLDRWLEEAIRAEVVDPNAMLLATADSLGRPSARVVLLKDLDDGLTFYTNYESRKGRELEANPVAEVVFYWPLLSRQIRVSGRVERVDEEASDAYHATRPHGAQIGAWASPQSREIPSREWLQQQATELAGRYPAEVPRPAHWGGYRLRPDRLEFWQGRENRLHDRIEYRSEDGRWTRIRLAP